MFATTRLVFLVVLMVFSNRLGAQNTYNMTNLYVEECEGVLLDSDEGPEPGQYNHNEDFTFTICIPGAREIVLRFDFFATEENYDVLTIYDGPDKNAPVIATLSGIIQPPPIVVASSGCMTLHFKSDDNIVANGWVARWNIEIDEPEAPVLMVDSALTCPLNSSVFRFDKPIECENFDPANFSVVGPGGGSVSQVIALDCDPMTGLAQRFRVVFDPPVIAQGSYRLFFNGRIQDACDEWHDVGSNVLMDITNCPIDVEIELVEANCVGDCGKLRANIIGNAAPTYNYEWSHTMQNEPEVEVCADDKLEITLIVTDPVSGQEVIKEYTYIPLEIPRFLNPLDFDTICASTGDYFYNMSIPGGEFYSRIIPNDQRKSGRYQFWRWGNANGLQQDIVTYIAPNGCQVKDTLYTLPINAGSIQASCLGSAPFRVNGGTPTGGYWTGNHVSLDGMFDPVEAGRFFITYNAPNGCRRNKEIRVGDGITMPDVDTICSSQEIELLSVTPYGGRWSGPGVVHTVRGRIQGWRPTPNRSYTYYYDLEGCRDSLIIYIKQINAGPDRAVCDADSLLYLPIEGNWSGPGTYIDSINAFDISGLSTGKYNYTIREGGCSDRFELNVIIPSLKEKESLRYCHYDTWYKLEDKINIFPGSSTLSGPSVKDSSDKWWFNPFIAGPGRHRIDLQALGCSDSIWVEVEAPAVIPEYEFCEFSTVTQLQAQPPGGKWSGPGFLDDVTGLFDPQLLSPGSYEIMYQAPNGCVTNDSIEIFLFEKVGIDGLDKQYCHVDTIVQINLTPAGGTFLINGVSSNASFNPLDYGEGNHELLYTRGTGACASSERRFVTVLPPIRGIADVSRDSICMGESTVISVAPSGGSGTISANWDNGIGFGTSHIVNPTSENMYRVVLTDGCSNPYEDSVRVYVHPEFDISIQSGPEVCFNDTTWTRVVLPNTSDYSVEWQLDPPFFGSQFLGSPGIYPVEVTELFSGCSQEYDMELPGAKPLKANFSIIPNQDCIDIIDNEIQLIDLAIGYTDGWIDYGDGTPEESLLFGSLTHEYFQIGDYIITQYVTNELGCIDSISKPICVENKVQYFVPNAFSPNGDGQNDEFRIQLIGATDVYWAIFDRSGGLIFEAFSEEDSWDGTFQGRLMNPNVFVVVLQFKDIATGIKEVQYSSLTLIH
jgi:gliding motility-associated-like protein